MPEGGWQGIEWSETQPIGLSGRSGTYSFPYAFHTFEVYHASICGADLLSNYSSHWTAMVDTGAACLTLPQVPLACLYAHLYAYVRLYACMRMHDSPVLLTSQEQSTTNRVYMICAPGNTWLEKCNVCVKMCRVSRCAQRTNFACPLEAPWTTTSHITGRRGLNGLCRCRCYDKQESGREYTVIQQGQ